MHEHTTCAHDLKHCEKCDEVYCKKCEREWKWQHINVFPFDDKKMPDSNKFYCQHGANTN